MYIHVRAEKACKGTAFFSFPQIFSHFFLKKMYFYVIFVKYVKLEWQNCSPNGEERKNKPRVKQGDRRESKMRSQQFSFSNSLVSRMVFVFFSSFFRVLFVFFSSCFRVFFEFFSSFFRVWRERRGVKSKK